MHTTRRTTRPALRGLAGLLAGLLVPVLVPALLAQASAEVAVSEVSNRPSDGVFAIEGHGWGHGRGMSQWGAQGAASLGKTADQITSFYYPGTTRATLANTPIRVLLQADTGGDTQVYPATGLMVIDLATGTKATLPTGVDRWRAVVDSTGLRVQSYAGGVWRPWALNGRTTLAGPVQFSGPAFVRLAFPDGSSRDYRGALRAVKTSATTVATVNALPMESYLLGVVPRESSSSWQAAALQAQAIAARSYSAYKRERAPSTAAYDICDTTQCQVYGGAATWSGSTRTSLESSSTTSAINATAGVVRTYQGKSIFAEFSSSNGGWSTAGSVPYLVAQRDDWDGATNNNVHSWTATVTAAQLEARYPAVGTLTRMRVTARDGNGDWGGRVKQVVLEGVSSSGAATSVTTTGAGVYNANSWPARSGGLRSSWWRVTSATTSAVASQSAAPVLVRSPGASRGALTATLKNTGTTTWSTSGLHLAVASPAGQADPLVGGSTTPGVYTGTATSIAPGATAAFRFDLTGDGVPAGVHGRSYRLRNGSGPLFGATVSWQVRVDAPTWTASTAARPAAATARPDGAPTDAPDPVFADGRTVVVPVRGATTVRTTVRNTSNTAWPVGPGSPLRLGTSGPRDRSSVSASSAWLNTKRPAALGGTSPVAPGAIGTFDLTLAGNGRPVGATAESFEPVWEGRSWLQGALQPLTVVRVDPASPRLAETVLAPPSALSLANAPSGTAQLTVRVRNLGGQPWTVGNERLSAAATPLATSAWPSSTVASTLRANATRPGQAKVYPGEVGEYAVPLSAYRKPAGSYPVALQAIGPDGRAYGPRYATTVTVTAASFSGSLVRVGPSVDVPRAGTASTYFEVKNTGNVAWQVGSAVRSEVLTAGGSPSRAGSWLSPLRPGAVSANATRPGATAVQPGEVARFVVVLAGNGRAAGARTEPFGVLWETWTRAASLRAVLSYRVV